jgi:hypothetical protein
MSVKFATSGTDHLVLNRTFPVSGMPITMGAWVRPTTVNTAVSEYVIGLSNSGSDNQYCILMRRLDSGAGVKWAAYAEDTPSFAAVSGKAGTPTAGRWDFVVVRFPGPVAPRVAVLQGDGLFDHGQGTTTHAPTGLNDLRIGSCTFVTGGPVNGFDGSVAEYWIADSDIQDDNGQLSNTLLYQLAYGGPFSVEHVAARLVDYRSFRSGLRADTPGEVFAGRYGGMPWGIGGGSPGLYAQPPIPETKPPPRGYRPSMILPI